jgi:hypothetical protein
MINREKMIVVCAAVIMGWGLFSCTLEPTADSPANRAVDPVLGMPDGLTVYEPSITYDGTTTTLTYAVKVSNWPKEGLPYTAQKTANANNAQPQSIEALILRYGGLFLSPVTAVTANASYKLKPIDGADSLPHYVIIPLDTSRIKEELGKKLPANEKAEAVSLVWIEENPAIGEVEKVASTTWIDGKYEDPSGIRIGGFYKDQLSSLYPISTVENFDDGKDERIRSIATVLADRIDRDKQRYTSKINFYIDTDADAIKTGVSSSPPSGGTSLANAAELGQWMKDNKPVLRVVYEWAD